MYYILYNLYIFIYFYYVINYIISSYYLYFLTILYNFDISILFYGFIYKHFFNICYTLLNSGFYISFVI